MKQIADKDACNRRIPPFRIILLLCLTFLFSLPGPTQAQFGIKVGTTVSNLYNTGQLNPIMEFEIDLRPFLGYDIEWVQLGNQKPLFSPYINAYYHFKILPRLGLRPEVSFSQKGLSFNQYDYERIIYQVSISYLEMPVSVVCQFVQKERTISEIYAGGFGGIKIKAVKKVASHNSPIEKINLNSVNAVEAGLHLGANYKRKFSGKYFLIDIRLFLGLTDIFTQPENWTAIYFDLPQTKTTGLNLALGYEF
jgi:hypothetical protein